MDTRPALGGTPGPRSGGSRPGDSSPGSDPGVKGESWAVQGCLEEKPPDPYANLTQPDSLLNDPEQCHPKDHRKQSDDVQRARIEPLESEWT